MPRTRIWCGSEVEVAESQLGANFQRDNTTHPRATMNKLLPSKRNAKYDRDNVEHDLPTVEGDKTAWDHYNEKARIDDREYVKDWNENLANLLIFVSKSMPLEELSNAFNRRLCSQPFLLLSLLRA